LSRHRQNVARLLIVFAIVLAAVIYYARNAPPPRPNGIATSPTERAGPADIYPQAALTPGATNPEITQQNIDETICNPHWSTRRIRPPEEYTYRLKREQIGEYHDADTNARDYEEDHLIPLELGGSPTDPKNLWPEAYAVSIPDGGAKYKDKVESYLHDQVCAGAMPLAEAQQRIVADWYRVYVSSIR
jgi:hypothetical protein